MIQFYAKGTLFSPRLLAVVITMGALCYLLPVATSEPTRLRVLTTTSIIADTARQIAGPAVAVESLMGPGVDPHTYKASPGDLRKLSDASLVLYNGLHLEGKMAELLAKLGQRKPVIGVAERVDPARLRHIAPESEILDPHLWFDVSLWMEVASAIRDALASIDPAGASGYHDRFATLSRDFASLDTWCRHEFSTIPPERRVLITAHDAFGYLGRAYNIEVLGIQGVSTDSEASLREINALVSTIVTRGIPAVFIESTISPKTVHALIEGALAQGHTVAIGGELYSDALGDTNSPANTYQGMVRHNVTTITRALRPGGT